MAPGGDGDTIFVALAAYREPELADTIRSAIDGATRPERLRFGVCQQYDDSLPGAGFHEIEDLAARWPVRLLRYPHTASQGGCWARHRVQGLYGGEAFTLQLDAHTRLAEGWDTELVDLVESLPGPKPLLTGFPPLYTLHEGEPHHPSADEPYPITLVADWADDGWVQHPSIAAPPGSPLEPRPTRILSGAFVFTRGIWNVEVRQDDEHLYTGEEFALTLRSYTHGYDLWNPGRTVLWHRSHPTVNPKYIHDDPDGRSRRRHVRACRRLRVLLDGDPEGILSPYSLGPTRTLEDYARFSGLDARTRTISREARQGVTPRRQA